MGQDVGDPCQLKSGHQVDRERVDAVRGPEQGSGNGGDMAAVASVGCEQQGVAQLLRIWE